MSEKSEKCLKKRKYDSKYKSEWASEFAEVVKGSEETRRRRRRRAHIEMDRNAVLLEQFSLRLLFIAKIKCYNSTTMSIFIIVKES